MDRHNFEKKQLERQAIKLFMQLYNANYPIPYRLLYMHDKPDAVLEDLNQGKLGMEITHLFYDYEEAKRLLGRADGGAQGGQSLDTLIRELNQLIETKVEKKRNYAQTYPVSLLIRNTSETFGMSDILRVKDKIRHSKETFVDLWLLSRDGEDEWFMYNLDRLLEAERERTGELNGRTVSSVLRSNLSV